MQQNLVNKTIPYEQNFIKQNFIELDCTKYLSKIIEIFLREC